MLQSVDMMQRMLFCGKKVTNKCLNMGYQNFVKFGHRSSYVTLLASLSYMCTINLHPAGHFGFPVCGDP